MTMQADDIEAINRYFNTTTGRTPAGKTAKESWNAWYKTLGFLDKSFNGAVLTDAKNRRIAFDAANGDPKRADDGGLTKEEEQYFLNLPRTDVTGLTPEQAKAKIAAVSAGVKTPPPASLMALQYGVLRQGNSGESVKKWQTIIGVNPDGKFGPGTTAATKKWQTEHGLKPDGVVGSATWAKALAVPTATAATAAAAPTSLTSALTTTPASKPATTSTPTTARPAAGVKTGRPVLRLGSTGDAVKAWQVIVGVPATGTFDQGTKDATKIWQAKAGLVNDGVVGAATWAKSDSWTAPPSTVAQVVQGIKQGASSTTATMKASLGNVPLWAKVGGGVALGGGLVGLLLGVVGYAKTGTNPSRRF